MGELGGAATLEREPPNRRLRSATRPLGPTVCLSDRCRADAVDAGDTAGGRLVLMLDGRR